MTTSLYRDIGWNVMQLRQSRELTQEALAKLTGLSRHQISRIECGQGRITMENLILASDFFEVPVSHLCERVQRQEIDFRLRLQWKDKDDLKYSREISTSPRIKVVELSSKKIRRLKIYEDQGYDIYVLFGSILLTGDNFATQLTQSQCLSIKGVGILRLRSPEKFPVSRILLIQTAVD